jgi:serralysin
VAFVADGSSWSALGTECLRADLFPNQTMNLGWLTDETDDDEFSRVVTHEFGHALGCIHEHQNPDADIPWNTDAVYRYYAETQGWDKATVDQNMFRKWADTLHSTFDKESIMLYAVPKELTMGGYEVGWNRHLSEKDKAYIGTVYPPAAPAGV